MRSVPLAVCVVSLVSWWHPSAAQTRPLTLDEAIRLGVAHNPALTSTRSQAEATEAGARAAEASRWPRVTTEAVARRSDHQVIVFGDKLTASEFEAEDFALDSLNDPDPVTHLTAAVALEAPLFTSGRLRWGIASARSSAEAARAGVRAAESELASRITRAYFGIAVAREAVEVARSTVSSARGHEAVALARVEAGAALRSDHLRAQVFRLSQERDFERRLADLAVSKSRLAALLGLPPGEEPDPVTPLEPPSSPIGTLEEWLARGAAGTPAIEAGRRSASAAEAGARAARSDAGPEVAGFARYERNASRVEAGEGSYLFGVGIRWSAFDRTRAARISEADARRAAARAATQAIADAVRLEIEEAYYDAGAAERSLAVSREAVTAADAARRIASDRYAGGLLPLTDLLDMETDLMNARFSEIDALYRTVSGRVRLAHATGALEVPAP